ncbi:MAG: hypothetical protein J6I85_00145 [Clostridia bacterium]|nr:hypothetical protein [Clostridia bacterium]
MYRTDIRLVVKKEGFEVLKELCKAEKNEFLNDLMDEKNIKNKIADIVYLGWNNANYTMVEFIKDSLYKLEDDDISYNIAIRGENNDDVEIYGNIAEKDIGKKIPEPYIERSFNEDEIKQEIEEYAKSFKEKDKVDEIEYE